MSSLGDLLLGKIPEPVDVVEKSEQHQGYDDNDNNQEQIDTKQDNSLKRSPSDVSNDATSGQFAAGRQKIFPERIEKKRPETIEDDRRSNASSTDDLVTELLDPNDRPRNVWHVVAEGKEQSSPNGDDQGRRSRDVISAMEREPSEGDEVDGPGQDSRDANGRTSRGQEAHDEDRGNKERERDHDDRDLRRSNDRDRHDRKRSRDHDRDKNRDRERERERERDYRRRSPDRHSKSRSKRSRYSDEEDDDRDHKRHRSGRSRRHGRRSRSRSRSRDSGSRRRRHRSRSDSRSPVTRRNSKTILVMQLSPRVISRDLEDFFEDVGRVKEVRLIMDSKTRRHKGIAYIEFDSASSATKALALNGQKFHGAPLQIQSALSEKSRNSSDRHSGPSSSSHNSHYHSTSHTSSSSHYTSSRSILPPNSYRVYMGGLHVGITEDMLRTIVEPFGLVHKVEVIKDRTTGLSRGYAFITYASIDDGQEAIRNLDGFELAGKSLRVSKSTEKIH